MYTCTGGVEEHVSSLPSIQFVASVSDLVDHSYLQGGGMRYVCGVRRAAAVFSQELIEEVYHDSLYET